MTTAKQAEDYVEGFFKKKGINLVKVAKGEKGFDFRDKRGELFVEVKGTIAKKLSDVLFRYFTNGQYEKAKDCLLNKKKYEIHLVLGIGSDTIQHYRIPGKLLVEKGRPEVSWWIPIRQKEIQQFKV